ncbi:DUF3135 domain-containing protein [Marinobacter sp. F4206]|uniref:DUF3135 domain-containing protein n=1 Tax=Marinobacter sp. F4206 TaxID=2861777 RepID=UPI001C5D1C3A|nr:DUF3135 domain-containing protein [Marinobacter sp. F4206]MBW4934974.1 DUF3135 domain-containing protein [Marinobacter sp. F4206]
MDMPTFDELKDLAQRDPAGFEVLRAEAIEDCIRRSSECNQRRLRGLQFVIEARRRVAGSPMKALLDIQAMMYESLLGLQQALLDQQRPCAPRGQASARVLHLKPPRPSVD